MMIVMKEGASAVEVRAVISRVEETGAHAHVSTGDLTTVIGVIGDREHVVNVAVDDAPGVDKVVPITKPYKLASAQLKPGRTVIDVDGRKIGGAHFMTIAGPCTVESREQLLDTAQVVRDAGAQLLRGGAYKPRTSPYSFQGLGEAGLRLLADAKEETGLPVTTELMDVRDLDAILEVADVIQIGARNMQNYTLLTEVGRSGRPTLLKRGLSATLEELLLSAEYLLKEGNENVILCERGIRTFETAYRYTLDLLAVPVLKEMTHLPVTTELMDVRDLDDVLGVADVIQIGARNMHNYTLLTEVGRSGRPTLLKRGLSSTLEELLLAAEYLLREGNENVILCERGIRTFETAYRYTLDLLAVPVLKEMTHLPVIVDPSHAAGRRDLVLPMSLAAAAAGADGVIVETHPDPEHAICDGPQALRASEFSDYLRQLEAVAALAGKELERV